MIIVLFVPLALWLILIAIRHKKNRRLTSSRSYWRLVAICAGLLLIALGPSIPGEKTPAGMLNLDVIIIVDRTASISAEDYDGAKPRLEGVKSDLLSLVKTLSGARIALITFDSAARLNVPFSTDSSAAATAVATLDQEMWLYSRGSNIGMPVELVTKLLKQSKTQHPDRGRLVFYVGDGEQTDSSTPTSFSSIKSLVNGGAVLGYGTEQGGKMKQYSGYSQYEGSFGQKYIEDFSGATFSSGSTDAVSKIDEKNLKTIASDMNVPYVHRTSLSQSMDDVVAQSRAETIADTHREVARYMSMYWIVAIVLCVLLLWWLIDDAKLIHSGLAKEKS